ncbi:hypothetical protein BCR36DRAFT_333777 [Piromyces finnis]|uniref:C3H1-type domain-containing protein n=1 Tax=Piromyces finnis TaxID=1754191 RepID=A0A1Y1V3F4_9FUNG|nr:hypothetical protein BCR36DRAFT_333777 [Piromyces finnis]|eukprot:ORX45030.1 hypothetical protein BCR36DRAFT_333777 [Piromyces finnis]
MGKNYYCDYCDRSFVDTPEKRKNHLNSQQHILNVKNHYNSFKEPRDILIEKLGNPICQNFFKNGFCSYGLNCKFSHVPYFQTRQESINYIDANYDYLIHKLVIETNMINNYQIVDKSRELKKQYEEKYKHLKKYVKEFPPSMALPPPEGYDFSNCAEWG